MSSRWISGVCRGLLVSGAVGFAAAPLPGRGEMPGGVDRDGRVGSAGAGSVATESDGAGGVRFLIRESDGQRAGQNLFHSFSRFDLASNETAVYQGDPGIRNLVTTITGDRSTINGRISSEIPGADLFLINPNGIVFGENATVDLSGALTVSTADELIFSDGQTWPSTGAPPAILSVADPVGFGFLDAPAPIRIVGSRIRMPRDTALSLVGGDIDLVGDRTDGGGALVFVPSGRLDLVSLASAGRVFLEEAGVRLEGDPARGNIRIVDEFSVTTGGLDGEVLDDLRNPIPPALGAGPIFVLADDLLIRDADLRTLTVTDQAASDIAIDLTGDLTIEGGTGARATGIFADTGYREVFIPGARQELRRFTWPGVTILEVDLIGGEFSAVRFRATGDAGAVRIAARNVSLLNGGKITARSEFSGDAGRVEIDFRDTMTIAGNRGPDDVSQISTNANGTGNPGTIQITSETGVLRMDDSGALVIQNSANSLGTSLPGEISVDVARLEMAGDARIDSSTRGAGPGGILDIVARERMTLEGRTDDERFTGISTLSQPGATGPAGEIRIATANLTMKSGAEISARPADATSLGAAGNLRLEIGNRLVMQDATISTESPNAAGGNIDLAVSGVVDLRRSSITTSVTSGPESGGNITLRPGPDALVLDHSEIIARADEGAGGRIDLAAGIVIADATSAIDASSTTGIDGVVLINGVEGNIVPEVADLATPSADASSLLREPCAARRPGASNRFVVDEGRRVPLVVDDYLSAPLAMRPAGDAAEAVAARASEADERDASLALAPNAATDSAGCTF